MAPRNGSGLSGSDGEFRSMSEINVTPLVDVMLVLLIIFMVTAPFMLQSVKVRLPETGPVAPLTPGQTLVVSVQADGATSLGREAITLEALEARLRTEVARETGLAVQLRADAGVPYGRITEVMVAISRAGVGRLGFVTAAAPRGPGAR